ncbi:pro-sigmaK processing inhibitor BofA family protein [Paenibacillus herberti]|uniref:Pro-sigmaK processing inhibitor BofA n=1 Tax=Paenibacillus herberti TaxID=1619309 RepID=A0A229NXR3_9BACL|nr:pro-sigmaK processing inhibitor BofA family protein [Paenibacillus herberti]OXM14713.1 pro-sigmaK processing inhibitor BofA [Paenibacillus herberti]
MKWIWLSMLSLSSILLVITLVRSRMSWSWFSRFALHLTAAAVGIYLLNGTGLLPGSEIPLNPATISTAVVLGLPGVAVLAGIQAIIL